MGLDVASSYREADSSVPASPSSEQHLSPREPESLGRSTDQPPEPSSDLLRSGTSLPPWLPAGDGLGEASASCRFCCESANVHAASARQHVEQLPQPPGDLLRSGTSLPLGCLPGMALVRGPCLARRCVAVKVHAASACRHAAQAAVAASRLSSPATCCARGPLHLPGCLLAMASVRFSHSAPDAVPIRCLQLSVHCTACLDMLSACLLRAQHSIGDCKQGAEGPRRA